MHALPRRNRKGGEADVREALGQAAHRRADESDERRLDLRPGSGGDEPGKDGDAAFPGGCAMSDGSGVMSDRIKFFLDGEEVEALPGETLWQVANRRGTEIPHLCYSPAPGYRPDGNCRACMVEIEGERVLAASCIRKPTPGMKVKTATERAKGSRKLVFELLVADQP